MLLIQPEKPMPLFPTIRRWYHTKCIALNKVEIAESEQDLVEMEHAGDVIGMLQTEYWIDDCKRSIRHHEMMLNRLGALDTEEVPQPTNER